MKFTQRTSELLRFISIVVVISCFGFFAPAKARDDVAAQAFSIASGVDDSLKAAGTNEPSLTYFPLNLKNSGGALGVFGVQYYYTLDPAQGSALQTQAGARWGRFYAAWSLMEPTNTPPDQYLWGWFDYLASTSKSVGMELILNINAPPDWARDLDGTKLLAVEHFPDFVEYVTAVVERYDGDGYKDAPGSPIVTYFEIFNEPDRVGWREDHSNWGEVPDLYADLLAMVYPSAKAASPNAQIVMGGLALDWFQEDGGPFNKLFLNDVLAECAGRGCFDVVNFHYYPLFYAEWDEYGPGLVGKTNYVRQVMQQYGYGSYPIICTEIGWGSSTDFGGDRAQQRFVVKTLAWGLASDLETVIFYKNDDRDELRLPGLLTTSFTPKPAYNTMKMMLPLLNTADYVHTLTATELGSSLLEGYQYLRSNGQRVDVMWYKDLDFSDPTNEGTRTVQIHASSISVYNMYGHINVLSDGGDGIIPLIVGGDPLIVVYN